MVELQRFWLDRGVVRAEMLSDLAPSVEILLDLVPLKATAPALNDRSRFVIEAPLPMEALSDGVSVVLLRELGQDQPLGTLPIAAGSIVREDLAAEVRVLRAELDLLNLSVRQFGRVRAF
ncbi:MAG: hypothetical protein AAFQ51_10070 [Pseudomonadota bacterium]